MGRGYHGYFESFGIPSGAAFELGVKRGQIEAIDLVESGIKLGRLSPDTLEDSSYIHSVKIQLDRIDND